MSMKRREFITLLGSAAATWPLAARAQVSAGRKLIACLSAGAYGRAPLIAAFQEGMRDLGYFAGRNIDIVYRFAETQPVREWIARHGGLSPRMMYLTGRELASMYPTCQ